MAKNETPVTAEEADLAVITIIRDALRTKPYPKSLKELLLGFVRALERRNGIEPAPYNHLN